MVLDHGKCNIIEQHNVNYVAGKLSCNNEMT